MQFLFPATASVLFVGIASASLYNQSSANHTCLFTPPFTSCSANANPLKVDSCCVETYGGLLLTTQLWNTYTGLEDEGQLLPKDSWGLHGLWPDFCNGSYTQYCDLSRQYDPEPSPNTTNSKPDGNPVPPYTGPTIDTFIKAFGKHDLLAWMTKYWIAQNQPNTAFWAHEFSKHATCYSTFDVPCYGPQYVAHEEVVDFLETAIRWYQKAPTWAWLVDAAITPSNHTTYSLADVQTALTARWGAVPYLACSGPRFNETALGNGTLDAGFTALSEVWYYSHVRGRPQDGDAVPVNATGSNTNCAKAPGAIHYYERTPGSVRV
ncbi:uncharacterized protein K452DRAFT_288348 [Aplosporella prunicola CBS 121167]|uniref:ribonuclease T2 n=1 Tax=Aplosporella prunicola CBS 121167 TaxID=1176127 RepID=A0A6A6BCI9_9PEZI|nr:uncharacterized protein K452DRAFT_288348 [Aplosporella prunicola CBS 121167]KAF2140954.1 hypothetical protein K452DRAFT_288348 [Aplosporella prunicola CBS 121167]